MVGCFESADRQSLLLLASSVGSIMTATTTTTTTGIDLALESINNNKCLRAVRLM